MSEVEGQFSLHSLSLARFERTKQQPELFAQLPRVCSCRCCCCCCCCCWTFELTAGALSRLSALRGAFPALERAREGGDEAPAEKGLKLPLAALSARSSRRRRRRSMLQFFASRLPPSLLASGRVSLYQWSFLDEIWRMRRAKDVNCFSWEGGRSRSPRRGIPLRERSKRESNFEKKRRKNKTEKMLTPIPSFSIPQLFSSP